MQLTGRSCVAQLVRRFAVEPGAPGVHVQSRAHPVAALCRRRDRHRFGERDLADPDERISDDLGLQRNLRLVSDVGIQAAAARRVEAGVAA